MSGELDKLHGAIKRGDVVAVRDYIATGGAISTRDRQGWTPLAMAAYKGNTEIIRLLLDAGANVNEGWPGANTPLVLAAVSGSEAAVELLLVRGAKTDAENAPVPELLRQFGYGCETRIIEAIQKARDSEG